jgi:hypothetical protein
VTTTATTSPLRRPLQALLGVPFTSGNSVEVLPNGVEMFPALLGTMARATRTVDLLPHTCCADRSSTGSSSPSRPTGHNSPPFSTRSSRRTANARCGCAVNGRRTGACCSTWWTCSADRCADSGARG